MSSLIHWMEQHELPCFYQQCLGIPCPGCGMQRSFIELLQGNVADSFRTYPALIPLIIMMGFLILHLIRKFSWGGIVLRRLFILNAVIIFFSYLYKLIQLNIL